MAETEQKQAAADSMYFPEIKNQSRVAHTTAEQNVEIPAGAFGVISSVGHIPSRDILINKGNKTFVTSGTMATQPLTPLIRIHQANRIAVSNVVVSRDELKKAENEVALKVHEVYYVILIARVQKRAAGQDSAYSRTHLLEAEQDVRNGAALKVAIIESQAGLLRNVQALLTVDLGIADLKSELNDPLGLPLDKAIELSPVTPVNFIRLLRVDTRRAAMIENPQIAAALEAVQQAKAALTAAKSAYIPDVSVFSRHSYQNGAPFLAHNFGAFGAALSYDVFEFGKRRAVVRERDAQVGASRAERGTPERGRERSSLARPEQGGANETYARRGHGSRQASRRGRTHRGEPIDKRHHVCFGPPAGVGGHLQGTGRLTASRTCASAC